MAVVRHPRRSTHRKALRLSAGGTPAQVGQPSPVCLSRQHHRLVFQGTRREQHSCLTAHPCIRLGIEGEHQPCCASWPSWRLGARGTYGSCSILSAGPEEEEAAAAAVAGSAASGAASVAETRPALPTVVKVSRKKFDNVQVRL
jgi:hypothetical protein